MSAWFTLWLTLAGMAGVVWLIRFANIGRILRQRQILSSRSHPGPSPDAPKVSIIVAAKDEEDNIETCVTGLLDQDYPGYELIVVDDRSRDRTPVILRRLEREAGGRLRVITVKALREGWFGKSNAMREGVAVADGEWLLFTDADCRQTSRRTLSMAMREAAAHEIDFLSVTPILDTHTVWERIIQPVCTLALMTWFLPHRVNKPWRKAAYANGAFILMRRSCYEAIGGYERVRNELNEDVQMARLAKQMGLGLRVVENDDLYRTRMYDSLPAAWRGWSRLFYGCLVSLRRLSAAALLLALLCILPWISLVIALAGLQGSQVGSATEWGLAACLWGAAIALMQLVMWRVYDILRTGRAWSFTYVLGAFVVVGMLINAMFKAVGARPTTWRGTTYRGRRLEGQDAVASHSEPAAAKGIEEPATHA